MYRVKAENTENSAKFTKKTADTHCCSKNSSHSVHRGDQVALGLLPFLHRVGRHERVFGTVNETKNSNPDVDRF